jgi:outer membrane protein assembly factor BamB
VFGSTVIAAQEDGRIFALDRGTGAVRWIAPRVQTLPGPDGSGGTPNDTRTLALAGNILIATSETGAVVALDAATGAQRWRTFASSAGVVTPPSADDAAAYVTHLGLFVAYALSNGAVRWELPVDESEESEYLSTAIPDGDRLYIAGGHGFYALRKR